MYTASPVTVQLVSVSGRFLSLLPETRIWRRKTTHITKSILPVKYLSVIIEFNIKALCIGIHEYRSVCSMFEVDIRINIMIIIMINIKVINELLMKKSPF